MCDFSCISANFVVPLHREPAPGMSAHHRRRVADIIKKRLLALVLVIRKPEIFANPKQEGSKRPLGYVYPAAEHPLLDCSVWWHFIFGVGVRCLFLLARFFPVPLIRE